MPTRVPDGRADGPDLVGLAVKNKTSFADEPTMMRFAVALRYSSQRRCARALPLFVVRLTPISFRHSKTPALRRKEFAGQSTSGNLRFEALSQARRTNHMSVAGSWSTLAMSDEHIAKPCAKSLARTPCR
jgi:hypothetical protein